MAKSEGQKSKIFLCHAPEDKKGAQVLFNRLSKDGYFVWRSAKSVLPGQDWKLEILKAIQSSDIVIICLSQTSTQAEGYFQKEIKEALERAEYQPEAKIFIIPVCLDKCEVPERLKGVKEANLFEKGGYKTLLAALAKQTESASSVPEKKQKSNWLIFGKWLIGAVALLAMLAAYIIWRPPSCAEPIHDAGLLIKPSKDVELVSDSHITGGPVSSAQGILRSQGSIDLSNLLAEQRYSLTLNGKWWQEPNGELRKISHTWTWLEGYWDFMSVTVQSTGNMDSQYLLGVLPPGVTLCSEKEYRAKLFVKDAANNVVLGINDFLFKVESSDSIPYALNIDISSTDMPKPIPTIQMTNTTSSPTDLSLKGDSLVTVNIKTLNPSGVEIPSDTLIYHWELCCDDSQNKTPDDSHLPLWKFKPPTYIPTEELTITVSNAKGYSVKVRIPFKIVPRY